MPEQEISTDQEIRHTDEMQDIITAVPSWLVRWGITVFFFLIVMMITLSAFIRYPDIVKTQLIITSPDMPKQVVSRITGKVMKILVKNMDEVVAGQPLAYLESTASHDKVLHLLSNLEQARTAFSRNGKISPLLIDRSAASDLGEMQSAYQLFVQAYLSYLATTGDGPVKAKIAFLQKDIAALALQTDQLQKEKTLQERDLKLAKEDYAVHSKLAQQKVETPAELRQQESRYLAKEAPLLQTAAALTVTSSNVLAKQKEIMELNNMVKEEKVRFSQALNNIVSQAEDWKAKYIMTAAQAGKVTYAGIVQQFEMVSTGQVLFYVDGGNDKFYGEMNIPQFNSGKVRNGQEVLIKLRSFPFEEFGMLRGRISYLSDVPYRDSVFISKVNFMASGTTGLKKPLKLRQGMVADAEIITQDATLLQRFIRNLTKAMNSR